MGERKTNDQLIEEIKTYWNNIQRLTNDMYIRPNKLSTEELMAEFEYPQSKPQEDSRLRLNQTPKGLGYFGAIPTKDGGTMTELSMGTPGDTEEIFAPLINPLLSREEIDLLAEGKPPTKEIYRKAQTHAKDRIEQGLSPFAGSDEVRELPQRKENNMKLDAFLKKLAENKVELPDAKEEKKEVDINATKVVTAASSELDMGKEVEKEHAGTYQKIINYYNENKAFPSLEQVAEWIATDHLNEPGNDKYYTKLKTIEPNVAKEATFDINDLKLLINKFKLLKPGYTPLAATEMELTNLSRMSPEWFTDELMKPIERSVSNPTKSKIGELDRFLKNAFRLDSSKVQIKPAVMNIMGKKGAETKPTSGLDKLINESKILKGGAFNLNQVLKELEEKAAKNAMTSTVKNPVKNMYSQMVGVVPTKDNVDFWLKREGRRIVR